MLKFQTTQDTLQIMGSFHIKDHLKSLGAKWNPDARSWDLPIAMDNEEFREVLKERLRLMRKATKDEEEKKRIYDTSPEGIAAKKAANREIIKKCLEEKKKTGAYHWICCEECEVIDWVRQHTSCDACADDNGFFKNTFCVRGVRYTGD
jgi:hypothetical protein